MISQDGIGLIKHYEGCRLTAYKDPVGVWTIGYGQTAGVHEGMTITQAEAESLLADALRTKYAQGVMRLASPVPQCQFDALVSFAYNLGTGALARSTLLRKLKGGDIEGAADEFPKWHLAGGKSLHGLRKRRAAERALFLGASLVDALAIGDSAP